MAIPSIQSVGAENKTGVYLARFAREQGFSTKFETVIGAQPATP